MDSLDLLNKFQKLEQEGKYEEIIKEFENLPDNLSKAAKFEIEYLYSKALFIKGKYFQALEVLDGILEDYCPLDDFLAKIVHQKAVCYLVIGSFKKAEEMFDRIFAIPDIATFDIYPRVLVNFANMVFYQGKLIKSKEIYEKALEEHKKRNLPIDKVLNNLVLVYSQLGLYQKALETSSRVIELKEAKKDWHGWCIALVNRSIVLSHFEQREEAYNSIARVLNFAEEKGWLRVVAGAYSNLASLQMRDFNEKDAEESLKKAKAILDKIHVKDILAPVISKLAYINILREEFSEAEMYIKELYNLAEEQESTFALVWSSLLETLLFWKKTKKKKCLVSFLKFLHKQFDLEIHNMLFQSSFFMVYQFLQIDDPKLTKKA
ncbi:MAG: tetratricopeptide repeat protein, partial [Candidatus Heimdallarchaeaceae archaeon]